MNDLYKNQELFHKLFTQEEIISIRNALKEFRLTNPSSAEYRKELKELEVRFMGATMPISKRKWKTE